jgi:hypothetical protein
METVSNSVDQTVRISPIITVLRSDFLIQTPSSSVFLAVLISTFASSGVAEAKSNGVGVLIPIIGSLLVVPIIAAIALFVFCRQHNNSAGYEEEDPPCSFLPAEMTETVNLISQYQDLDLRDIDEHEELELFVDVFGEGG